MDQGTIRRRIKNLQKQGILAGWFLGVSPSVTGHRVANVWLETEPHADKRELMEELLTVQGVERVCSYLSPKLSLVLLYKGREDLDASLKRIATLAGSNKVFHEIGATSSPGQALTETDLAIVGSLRQDPWKPHATVARELRMSSRTVKRRVTRLSEGGAIYMLPNIDLKAFHGIVPAELVVHYESKEQRSAANERIMSQIRDELLFSNISESHGYFALSVSNTSRVEQITRWAKQQTGVREVHSDVLQDVILNRSHYEQERGRIRVEAGRMEK